MSGHETGARAEREGVAGRMVRRVSASLAGMLCLMLLLNACRSEAPPSAGPQGHFQTDVEGALARELQGTAAYRVERDGQLVGLELSAADSLEGLSFETEPRPLRPRTYRVEPTARTVHEDQADPNFRAYMEMEEYSFMAVAGTLRVDDVRDGFVTGSFDLRMEGAVEAPYDERSTVLVRGQFEAVEAGRYRETAAE